jgi:3-dehydroquinate dehydratase
MVVKELVDSEPEPQTQDDTPLNFEILEKRIDYLTKEYQQNILKAVRAFYEK